MSDSESDSTSESTSEIKTEVLGEPATVESDSGSVAAENTTTKASTTPAPVFEVRKASSSI